MSLGSIGSWVGKGISTLNTSINAMLFSGLVIHAGDSNFGIYASSNAGSSWAQWNTGLINTKINSLVSDGSFMIAGTNGGGVFRSLDGGLNWQQVNNGMVYANAKSVLLNNGLIFAGTWGGGVYVSSDSGASWSSVSTGLTNTYVRALLFISPYLIAATSDGVFATTNAGSSWTDFGMSGTSVSALAANGTYLFAGTNTSGVWRRPLSELLPVELVEFSALHRGFNVEVQWKTATETNNYGFEIQRSVVGNQLSQNTWEKVGFVEGSGTSNVPREYSFSDIHIPSGKYSYRLKQIDRDGKFGYSRTAEVIIGIAPKEFALAQNYPNPFNPTTVIRYQLPVVSNVTLKIYDVLGREVATLVNEEQSTGWKKVKWNANVASGINFYRIEAVSGNNPMRSFTQVRKMMLIR